MRVMADCDDNNLEEINLKRREVGFKYQFLLFFINYYNEYPQHAMKINSMIWMHSIKVLSIMCCPFGVFDVIYYSLCTVVKH